MPPCGVFDAAASVLAPGGPDEFLNAGLAFGDVDLDGDVDAVVAPPTGLIVLLGDGAGGFTPAPGAVVGGGPTSVVAITLADWDGDADLDLLLTTTGPARGIYTYLNDGAGAFTPVVVPGVPMLPYPIGVTWGDYDRDGYLDVYIAGYMGSALLRNLGGVAFEDVAPAFGIHAPTHAALQPTFVDYDLDGDLDLVVANDRGPTLGTTTALYRNDGSGFTDVTAAAGFTERIDGMGIAVGDVDGDVDIDVFVTNIGAIAPGQLLYLNQGDGTFLEASAAWQVALLDAFAWGAVLADFENDGDLDLAVAGMKAPWGGVHVGENWGHGFIDLSDVVKTLPAESTYGLATADFDADGRLDLGWSTRDSVVRARLYRNVWASPGHWLRVRLAGPPPNVHGLGATIFVDAGGRRHVRQLVAGSSYGSTSEGVAHFGLGATTVVDAIEVWWPTGLVTVTPGPIDADQIVTLSP